MFFATVYAIMAHSERSAGTLRRTVDWRGRRADKRGVTNRTEHTDRELTRRVETTVPSPYELEYAGTSVPLVVLSVSACDSPAHIEV